MTALATPILAEHAAEIRRLGKRVFEDVIEIGRRLNECRAILKEDGGWRAWLETELRLSPQTAGRFIQVYERRSNLEHLDVPISTLYLLAAPSTPDEARAEVFARAEAGEAVTVADVKRSIATTKGRAQPAIAMQKPTTDSDHVQATPTNLIVPASDVIIAEYTMCLMGMIDEAAHRLDPGDCVTLLERMQSIINGLLVGAKQAAKNMREEPPKVVERATDRATDQSADGIPEFLRRTP
jgi:hypothetical protein